MVNEVIEVILTGGRLEKVLNEEIGRLSIRSPVSPRCWNNPIAPSISKNTR